MKLVANSLVGFGFLFLFLAFFPLLKDEVTYLVMNIKNQNFVLVDIFTADKAEDSPFARLLSSKPIALIPVNKDFSIVIEKIGVNAPIIKDVPITDKDSYEEALKNGVAHAGLSQYPSEDIGNVYLFAHASVNFWELGKYATVFNLLRKLEFGDQIHVFYEGEDFVYEVVNKEVKPGWDTYPITRSTIEPILTLQTCDPPGTTLNRLVVTAKLIEQN